VIRLGTTVLAEARAEWIARQIRQLPITVAAENMAFIIDLVIYARNIFVAIPASPVAFTKLFFVKVLVGFGTNPTKTWMFD